jgi:hypothetical protein
MSGLPLYDENATCSKCGSDLVAVEYRVIDPDYRVFLDPPRMVRTCQRCRATWHELPLDTKGAST